MTPTETRHFRMRASYNSAIDCLSATRQDERAECYGSHLQNHLIYELSTLHPFLPTPHLLPVLYSQVVEV